MIQHSTLTMCFKWFNRFKQGSNAVIILSLNGGPIRPGRRWWLLKCSMTNCRLETRRTCTMLTHISLHLHVSVKEMPWNWSFCRSAQGSQKAPENGPHWLFSNMSPICSLTPCLFSRCNAVAFRGPWIARCFKITYFVKFFFVRCSSATLFPDLVWQVNYPNLRSTFPISAAPSSKIPETDGASELSLSNFVKNIDNSSICYLSNQRKRYPPCIIFLSIFYFLSTFFLPHFYLLSTSFLSICFLLVYVAYSVSRSLFLRFCISPISHFSFDICLTLCCFLLVFLLLLRFC